jgi:exodeoxyribonuclease V alpha subunit
MMARLAEAIRPDARLVLVGDPDQLVSIEAGAVLGDIVGPARRGLVMGAAARETLASVVSGAVVASDPPLGVRIGEGIVVLDHVHRYGGGIADLAAAIRAGNGDDVMGVLTGGAEGVTWIPVAEDSDVASEALAPVRSAAVEAARSVLRCAVADDAGGALAALGGFRLLCAHRRGPLGVANWTARIERWLAEEADSFGAGEGWYVGRPLLVTENDYELQLYNGDTGVVLEGGMAAFARGTGVALHSVAKLGSVETAHAMTIHKSQGSQFRTAAVLLPEPGSRILTRELLYTAATRAQAQLVLAGTEEAVRAAVARPVARASGLGWRLWG